MTKQSQASAILKGYGLKLPEQWTGSINCWHRWHKHEVLMCWWTTYDEYLDRIIEVDSIKPINERAVRFMAFRPVRDKRLRNFNLDKARAEYQKAEAPAWAEYQKAVAPAWAEYEKAEAAALAEYEKAKAAALAEYEKAKAAALAEYQKSIAPAWAEYLKAIAPAEAEYQKAVATAWENIDKGLGFSIKSIHDKECKDVPFIKESNELRFKKS